MAKKAKQYRVQLMVWMNVEAHNKDEAIEVGREWLEWAMSQAVKHCSEGSVQHPVVLRLSPARMEQMPAAEALPLDINDPENGSEDQAKGEPEYP